MKKLKKTLVTFILSCLFWGGLILLCGVAGYLESTYTRNAVCSNSYYENHNIIYEFTDISGNVWEWSSIESDSESYKIGNTYKLTMFDEKTASIYDDSILKIRKSN